MADITEHTDGSPGRVDTPPMTTDVTELSTTDQTTSTANQLALAPVPMSTTRAPFTKIDAENQIDQTLYTAYRARLLSEGAEDELREALGTIVVYTMTSKVCHLMQRAEEKFKLTAEEDEEFIVDPLDVTRVEDHDELITFATEHKKDWYKKIIEFLTENPQLSPGIRHWVDTTDAAGNSRCDLVYEAMWEDIQLILLVIAGNECVNRAGAELVPLMILGGLVSEFGDTMMHGVFLEDKRNDMYQVLLSAIGIARSVYPVQKIVAVGGSHHSSMLLGAGTNFERANTFVVFRTLQTLISGAGSTLPLVAKVFEDVSKNGLSALLGYAGRDE